MEIITDQSYGRTEEMPYGTGDRRRGDTRAFPLDSERSGENQCAQAGCRSSGEAGLGCTPSIWRARVEGKVTIP